MAIPKNRRSAFEAIRTKLSDRAAAAISWAGRTRFGRKRMARKAARTRKQRGES